MVGRLFKLDFGRLKRATLIAAMVLAVALPWQQVFAVTGVSRWQQTAISLRPAPPQALDLEQLHIDWVDLEIYQQTHPVWQP